MEYILNENQYSLICEKLGVPDSILESAEMFYNIFLNHLKSIKTKKQTYRFSGDVDITLGKRKPIKIDSYVIDIEIHQISDFNEPPAIASMGMSQSFKFDTDILMKIIDEDSVAEFNAKFVVPKKWDPSDLYDMFINDRDEFISVMAHELKHKYDKQSKRVGLLGDDAEYSAIQSSPRFGIPVIDNKFFHYLYYTNVAENLARSPEVASQIRTRRIGKDQFKKFLKENKTFRMLVDIKNFTFEDLINGIKDKMGQVNELVRVTGNNPNNMSDDEKIDLVLKLVYINIANTKVDVFNYYIMPPQQGFSGLIAFFTGQAPSQDQIKIEKIRKKFFDYVSKYNKNHVDYFKFEIDKFNKVAEKMFKKLAKLYDMTNENVNESIINWDLHTKLLERSQSINDIEIELRKYK
jgi:hypothetical protein